LEDDVPTFTTPGPIRAAIKLAVGEVTIVASDRSDTVVRVAPYNPARAADVKSAQHVDVGYTEDGLRIKQAHPWRHKYRRNSAPGTVSITVELPSGSEVRGKASLGTFRRHGLLGKCEFSAASGQLQLDEIGGDLRARNTNGSILVQRAHANIDARTSVGNIVVGEVVRGTADFATAVGEVEVGVHPDTAADLNVRSRLGRIRNTLTPGTSPVPTAAAVKIRARTSLDDIVIRRA
jgi:DUF4097 and DUF4098 domain-containing protein YvlB